MASQVQIVISVDDKGAISALQQVGAQAKQLGPSFQKSGAQGNVVFTELTKQTQQAHDASTLFSRLLGVQLPRQLDTFIAKSRTLAPVFANLFNAAIIASFVVAIATALASLIEQWQAYADAVKNAQREIQKAAGQEETQLLEQTLAKNRQLRLSAESSLATELQKADLKFHADRQATLEELYRAEGLARITGETDVVRKLNQQLGLLDQEHLANRKRLLIVESGAVQ
jgi:Tfp pilus assembly protein PilE